MVFLVASTNEVVFTKDQTLEDCIDILNTLQVYLYLKYFFIENNKF